MTKPVKRSMEGRVKELEEKVAFADKVMEAHFKIHIEDDRQATAYNEMMEKGFAALTKTVNGLCAFQTTPPKVEGKGNFCMDCEIEGRFHTHQCSVCKGVLCEECAYPDEKCYVCHNKTREEKGAPRYYVHSVPETKEKWVEDRLSDHPPVKFKEEKCAREYADWLNQKEGK